MGTGQTTTLAATPPPGRVAGPSSPPPGAPPCTCASLGGSAPAALGRTIRGTPFKQKGQAIIRVTSTRLELDNIYRDTKGMLHMTLCNGSSYDFTHIWESACSARNRYRLSNRM